MLTYLPSSDDVIACRITGRMSDEEIADVTDRVLEAVERNAKTHIYCEIDGMTGFDVRGWAEQLPRGASLFTKLSRFGRIAVVSDQQWIRWATRIESAVLPGIGYEVFDLAERERALAWVEGKVDDPHDSRLAILPTSEPDVIAFEMTGRASAEAMKTAVREITRRFDSVAGPVRILGRFRKFRMPQPGGFDADYLRLKLSSLRKVERYAIVGGPGWFKTWVDMLNPLLRLEVRHFDASAEAAAWDWIGAKPVDATESKPEKESA